jgi:3-oxoacyl-[acyl-carrier protein] reductase
MTGLQRWCVVSGGGTGIGKEIARALADNGDRVMIIGRRKDVLESAAQDINAGIGADRVFYHSADLTKPQEVEGAAKAVTSASTPVDVLVNTAGGRQGEWAGEAELENLEDVAIYWEQNLLGNVLPAVLLTRALVPALRRPGGRVLAIGSMAAFRTNWRRGAYGAAKAAVHTWVGALAGRLAPEGITVNAIAPGRMRIPGSPTASQTTDEHWEKVLPTIPSGRLGEPEDMAAAARYLISPEAGYITGQVIQVNGGLGLGRS